VIRPLIILYNLPLPVTTGGNRHAPTDDPGDACAVAAGLRRAASEAKESLRRGVL